MNNLFILFSIDSGEFRGIVEEFYLTHNNVESYIAIPIQDIYELKKNIDFLEELNYFTEEE